MYEELLLRFIVTVQLDKEMFTVYKILMTALVLLANGALAEPNPELAYQLKASVVKVHVVTSHGGHGVGTGVAVAKDMIATNCHVLANATGVNITKFGDSFTPVAMKADWAHDLCILRFQYLDIQPVVLGDAESLQYEQAIFSIGFPGGPPKPQTNYGKVKALYSLDDSVVVRTDASFIMGASGSPVFDAEGRLVAISTFKSPGKDAFFYNMPVKWVKRLLDAPEVTSLSSTVTPFWDAPEEKRPYFMRVVLPYQQRDWSRLREIANQWLATEPSSSEAHYYLGAAYMGSGEDDSARRAFDQALMIQPTHASSLLGLAVLAGRAGRDNEVERIKRALTAINLDLSETLAMQLQEVYQTK